MNGPNLEDLGNLSMPELFRLEVEHQTAILISGLLALEKDPRALQTCDMLMRAAHSLKGAARIVNLQNAVRIAHALEDCFAAAQQGRLQLRREATDQLLVAWMCLRILPSPPRQRPPTWKTNNARKSSKSSIR